MEYVLAALLGYLLGSIPAALLVARRHGVVLRDLGIDLIGACCGSTPDHLRAMSTALR